VFAPLMFLPGYIGRLFVELAVAIAAAVGFSALLALSLSPMMASKLLKPAHGEGWLAKRVDRAMDALRNSYRASLESILGGWSAAIAGGLVVLLAAFAALLFVSLPKELVPPEDRGRVDVSISGPEGAGYDYTLGIGLKVEKIVDKYRKDGVAERILLTIPRFGGNSFNSGNSVVVMKPWGERKKTADEVAAELNKDLSKITSVRAIAVPARGRRWRGRRHERRPDRRRQRLCPVGRLAEADPGRDARQSGLLTPAPRL
jgi:multidrug efflux pump